MILHLNHVAIGSGLCQAEDRAVINPWMAGDNAIGFARFEQDSGKSLCGHVCKQLWRLITSRLRAIIHKTVEIANALTTGFEVTFDERRAKQSVAP